MPTEVVINNDQTSPIVSNSSPGARVKDVQVNGQTVVTNRIADVTMMNDALNLQEGWTYTKSTSDNKYQVAVPTTTVGKSEVTKICGATVAFNQHRSYIYINPSWAAAGVTVTKNETTGAATVTGTATAAGSTGMFITLNLKAHAGDVFYVRLTGMGTLKAALNGGTTTPSSKPSTSFIDTMTMTQSEAKVNIYWTSGETYNQTVTCDIVNLTQMFGKDNEPSSTTDERITAINTYLQANRGYNLGEIWEITPTSIKSFDSSDTVVEEKELPEVTATLPDWGMYFFGCGNYLEKVNGIWKYKRYVGKVDMGTLTWEYTESLNRFKADVPGIKNMTSGSVVPKLIAPHWIARPRNDYLNYDRSMTLLSSGNQIMIRDTLYTSAEEFTQAVTGKYLYFELDTLEVTDVQMANNWGFINTVAGGKVVYRNSYNMPTINAIAFLIKSTNVKTVKVDGYPLTPDSDGAVNVVRIPDYTLLNEITLSGQSEITLTSTDASVAYDFKDVVIVGVEVTPSDTTVPSVFQAFCYNQNESMVGGSYIDAWKTIRYFRSKTQNDGGFWYSHTEKANGVDNWNAALTASSSTVWQVNAPTATIKKIIIKSNTSGVTMASGTIRIYGR